LARASSFAYDITSGDELAGYTDTSLLATTDTFANGCSNQDPCLLLDTKGLQERLDTIDALFLADGAISRVKVSIQPRASDKNSHTWAERGLRQTSTSLERLKIQ
jgi:hypothetical protein